MATGLNLFMGDLKSYAMKTMPQSLNDAPAVIAESEGAATSLFTAFYSLKNNPSQNFGTPTSYPPLTTSPPPQLLIFVNGSLLPAADYEILDSKRVHIKPKLTDGDKVQFQIGFDYVAIARDWVQPVLDGVTPGTQTTVSGSVGLASFSVTGLVGTGLYRKPVGFLGELLYDANGRLLFGLNNPSAGFYDSGGVNITSPASLPLDTFNAWNTATQIEYIREALKAKIATQIKGSQAIELTIGPAGKQEHVMLSADQSKVYVLDSLSKADIARMSFQDQTALAGSSYFDTLGKTLGLSKKIDDALAFIAGKLTSKPDDFAAIVPGFNDLGPPDTVPDPKHPEGYFTADHLNVFRNEMANLYARVSRSPIFDPQAVAQAQNDIYQRYVRAKQFGLGTTPAESNGTIIYGDDGGATVRQGLNVFMAQESSILTADTQALNASGLTVSLPKYINGFNAIATVNDLGSSGKRLDAPMLIFLIQSLNFKKLDAINNANIQEVSQTNALLRAYSNMQTILNAAIAKFDQTASGDAHNLLGGGSKGQPLSDMDPASVRLVEMFEDDNKSFRVRNPIEVLKNIERPVFDLYNTSDIKGGAKALNVVKIGQLNTYQNELNDKVTQINQDSQIKMNQINSNDKEKNRYMDLATNALSKMSDTIQSIGRSISG